MYHFNASKITSSDFEFLVEIFLFLLINKILLILEIFIIFSESVEIITSKKYFFRLSAKADDIVNQENGTTSLKTNDVSVKKIDVSKNVNFINMAAHFGGGVEYNLSGSTYFFSSIYYQHGILNVTKETSAYLMRSQALTGGTPEISQFQNAMKLRQIVISVGVLF